MVSPCARGMTVNMGPNLRAILCIPVRALDCFLGNPLLELVTDFGELGALIRTSIRQFRKIRGQGLELWSRGNELLRRRVAVVEQLGLGLEPTASKAGRHDHK